MSTGAAQPVRIILWVCIVVSLIIVALELRRGGGGVGGKGGVCEMRDRGRMNSL